MQRSEFGRTEAALVERIGAEQEEAAAVKATVEGDRLGGGGGGGLFGDEPSAPSSASKSKGSGGGGWSGGRFDSDDDEQQLDASPATAARGLQSGHVLASRSCSHAKLTQSCRA